MNNVTEIFNDFKTKVEQEQFITKQHDAITALVAENKQLISTIEHLKKLLIDSNQLMVPVQTIIVSPEEGLIDGQIEMLRNRSFNVEMTLEDTKKLDLLLKNKNIIKAQTVTILGESKKVDKKHYSNAELIQLASQKGSGNES